jgi:putative DNA primase/helicase
MLRAAYDPGASCPTWEAFLESALPDPELRRYVQKCLGYSRIGSNRENCFFACVGASNSGKTTVLQAWAKMMGSYAAAVQPEFMLAKKMQEIPNELAGLAGKRVHPIYGGATGILWGKWKTFLGSYVVLIEISLSRLSP